MPPDELVDPPEEPPDEDVEPPDDEVDPPDDEVELVLLVLPPELEVDGSVPVSAGAGSVAFVSVARSELGFAKSSLSFAPPQAARTANDEATTALMRRRGFIGVAKH